MTIQYLQLHKYSATPRLAHLPAAPAPKPTMTMAEMAALENKAAGFGKGNSPQKKRGPIQDAEVLAELASRPDGAIIPEIADAIHRHPQSVANCCKRLVGNNAITGTAHKAGNNRDVILYRIAEASE